jgi:hypothetical protein
MPERNSIAINVKRLLKRKRVAQPVAVSLIKITIISVVTVAQQLEKPRLAIFGSIWVRSANSILLQNCV